MKIYCSNRAVGLDRYVGKDVWVLANLKGSHKTKGRKLSNLCYIRITGKSPYPAITSNNKYNYFLNGISYSDLQIANCFTRYDINQLIDPYYYHYAIAEDKIDIVYPKESYTTDEIREKLTELSLRYT